MGEVLTSEEKALVRKVRRMAGQGNFLAERWWGRLEAADTPKEKRDVLVAIRAEVERHMAWIKDVHATLEKSIGDMTGMTMEDFLWLRDLEEDE